MANGNTTTAVAMLLILTFVISLASVPSAQAHDPPWEIPSYAYIVPAPNPVGVGQRVSVTMWVDEPLPSAAVTNDIRRHDYTLTITAPDGKVQTEHWDVVSDTTSIQFYQFTPDQAGVYTLKFEYGGQEYTWAVGGSVYGGASSGSYQNDTFLPTSKTTTLTVQDEPLPAATDSYPLPTEYWARPIEGQNTAWYAISSNWLGSPYIEGAGDTYSTQGSVQPNGIAPNSPHIMWSRPIQDGGVVGGNGYHVNGTEYYMGGSYNIRFQNALIMNGRLYYELPDMNSGGGGGYICVDLRTGEEIWYRDFGSTVTEFNFGGRIYRFESSIVPAFGYLYDADYYNQHGVIPNGLLFTSGFGIAIDPVTAELKFNVTGVPSGTEMVGQNGEIYRLVLNSNGKWLAEWNSSKLWSYSTGVTPNIGSSGVVDASAESRYDWNATDLDLGPGSWSINRAKLGDIALLTQGSFGDRGNWYGANITAISLKPNSLGSILWTHQYDAAPGNVTRSIVAWDPDANVFVTQDKETMVFNGWSLTDGNHLWGPTEPTNDYTYFRQNTHVAYGKIYYAGYGGILYCYDITNGDLLWTYGNGGEGNSTNSALETAWGNYPEFVDVIADGKVYLATTEHSPNSPYYKDVKFRCVNATDGTEIWTLMGWGTGMDAAADVLADGFFVFLNCYDMQVYCVGKGPSAMTVEAPVASIVEGSSLVIRGTVTDIATGTQQKEQAARFPNGVPAVSDQSMGEWMEYVYMQKPRPTDTIGVNVTLSVIDSNGNYREIGTTTSDANGFFSYQWTPDIPGKYTVIASFAGSESYWPSQAETAFAVDPVPEITPGPTATPTSMSEMYFLPSVAGIIVAIAVVGALILLMLRRRP